MRLSDEQRKLVEENHNLIYSLLNARGWSIEDYYDLAAIGLCRAAIMFDPEKGYKFSTYAYTSMQNEILQELRKGSVAKRSGAAVLSFENPLAGVEEITIGDTIQATRGDPEEEIIKEDVRIAISEMKPKDREVINLVMQGYKQREVAKIANTNQVQVSRVVKRLRDKLVAYQM